MKIKAIILLCLILSAALTGCAKDNTNGAEPVINVETGVIETDVVETDIVETGVKEITPNAGIKDVFSDTDTTKPYPDDEIGETSSVEEVSSIGETSSIEEISSIKEPSPVITPVEYVDPCDLLDSAYEKYFSENEALINAHKEQYYSELRNEYKDVPVRKLKLLTTFRPDEHNIVEIYESAVYGRPATYVFENDITGFKYTGIDMTKDLYDYDIVSRLITDGADIYSKSHLYGDVIDWLEPASIIQFVSWSSPDAAETKAIAEMLGISCNKNSIPVHIVETVRLVDEPGYDYSVNIRAYYLGDSAAPFLINDYISYNGNDGDIINDHYQTCKGDEFALSLDQADDTGALTTVREGTDRLNGNTVQWKLMETPSGLQIIKIYCDDFGDPSEWPYSYTCDYYFYDNNNLIGIKGWYSL